SKTKVYVSITRVQTRERKDKGDVCLPHLGFEIRYLNDKGITGLSLCGRYNDIVIVSQGPEVYIEYHVLDSNNYFVLSYADTTSNFTESKITYEGKNFSINNYIKKLNF
uniref:CUB domain-containing protein n=1 Tax=Parastrongyloides trichosuri TaxID=131310 RepID=A0A0N4Z1K8_PARTI